MWQFLASLGRATSRPLDNAIVPQRLRLENAKFCTLHSNWGFFMDLFAAMVQSIPVLVQPVIIGSGFLREIMKHTIRHNPSRCFDFHRAADADFPCMDVVAARAHRFIANLGLFLTALASGALALNRYLRVGDISIAIGVGIVFAAYIMQERTRGQMEQTPQTWYDRNRELIYAMVYAGIGVTLSIASQEIQ